MGSKINQTRRQRLEAREDAIIAAAHKEFVKQGFDGTKMTEIASRAGIAEGTIYLYFKNKNALLGAVVGAFYARLTEGAAAGVMDCASTIDRLSFLARHHLKSCLDEWSILALAVPAFYRVHEYRESEFFEFNRTYVAVFDHLIREGISRGDLRDDLPLHLIRDLFFGTLEHATRTHMVRNQDPDDEQVIFEVAGQVMAMIQPAICLGQGKTPAGKDPDLEDLARRLEVVTVRLENT